MDINTVIDATGHFKVGMGTREERTKQVLLINHAIETFMQAAIELTDALAFDFDAEDDDHAGQYDEDEYTGSLPGGYGPGCIISDSDTEHDGAEQEQGEACAHYRMDQTIPTACQFYGQTVHPDTVL